MSLDAIIEDSDSPALSSWILCEVSFRWWSFYPSSQSLRTFQAFWIGETACGSNIVEAIEYWVTGNWTKIGSKKCVHNIRNKLCNSNIHFFRLFGVGNAGMECAKSTSQYLGLAWNGLGDDACKYLVWISACRSFDSAGLWGFKTFKGTGFSMECD